MSKLSKAIPETPSPVVSVPAANQSLVRSLCQKAIVLVLSISCFSGSKKDKKESARIATDNGANAGSVRVWKSLLRHPKTAAAATAAQRVRARFYQLTATWGRDGEGILPTSRYVATKLELERLIADFQVAASEAVASLPMMIEEDKRNKVGLGQLFDPTDYPSPAEFASRFGATLKPMPIPADDFRSGQLSAEENAEINQAIADQAAQLVGATNRDLLARLKEALERITTNVAEGKKVYAPTFAKVAQAAEEIEALNITANPEIARIAATAKEVYSKDETLADLFTSEAGEKTISADAATRLAEISEQMAAFA